MNNNRSQYRVVVLPGDHVGTEVTAAAVQVIQLINQLSPYTIELVSGLIGGAAIDEFGKFTINLAVV